MADTVKVCDVCEDVKERLKKFRFRKEKNIAAIFLKIDQKKLQVVFDEEFEDCTVDELREELPEHYPKYVVLSYTYKHEDGRVSYPLCFIYICPGGIKPELAMMYAGSKVAVQEELKITKIFELRDLEEFTTEWLEGKLKFFK